jgi:hypothetical protein
MRLGRGVLRLMDAFCGNQNDQRGLDVRNTRLGVECYSVFATDLRTCLATAATRYNNSRWFQTGLLQAGPRRHPLLILGSSDAEVGKTAQLPFAN